jgi:signal transduction histidine kinase
MIKSIWHRLTNLGVQANLSESTQLAIVNLNIQALASTLVSVPTGLILMFWVSQRYCIGVVILAICYLLTIWANKARHYVLAKYIFTFLGLLNLFWGAASLGYYSHLHLIFVLVGGLGAVFNKGDGIKTASIIAIIFGLLVLYLTNFSLFLTDDMSIEKQKVIGNVVFFIGIFSIVVVLVAVIFRMKEYESKLEMQNEALAKTTRELDFFVYSASHDLRAPITTLLGLINVMRIDGGNTEKYLGLQEKSLKKMDSFIIDLINYSHNARKELLVEKVDLETISKEALNAQSSNLTLDRVKISTNANTPFPAYSDTERIAIIMNILLSNAFRYQEPKRLNPFVKINFYTTKGEIIIEVTDNGVGIPENHIDKIFQLFYRADSYKSGSGLGLYILKESVEKLEGKVEVFSTVGEGTTFKITLKNYDKPQEGNMYSQMAATL